MQLSYPFRSQIYYDNGMKHTILLYLLKKGKEDERTTQGKSLSSLAAKKEVIGCHFPHSAAINQINGCNSEEFEIIAIFLWSFFFYSEILIIRPWMIN